MIRLLETFSNQGVSRYYIPRPHTLSGVAPPKKTHRSTSNLKLIVVTENLLVIGSTVTLV